ncbi:MAG: hypothetical protein HUJ73_01625, partial [Eubacterium sp.]|nr:hypothetical protein [Eubacterium sp.]
DIDEGWDGIYVDSSGEEVYLAGETGNAGRLTIPDLGYAMALDLCLRDSYEAQSITDAYDKAAYIKYYRYWNAVIADHSNHGFDSLYYAVPQETKAYISMPDGRVEEWICTESTDGENTEDTVRDGYGHDIFQEPADGIYMYTCQEDWQHVQVTYWERTGGTWDSREYADDFLRDEENLWVTDSKERLLARLTRPPLCESAHCMLAQTEK